MVKKNEWYFFMMCVYCVCVLDEICYKVVLFCFVCVFKVFFVKQ